MHNERPVDYDPREVNVIVKGKMIMNFAPDKVISISKNEDDILPNNGVKGDVGRAINANDSAIAEIVLQQSSSSIRYLSGLAERREMFNLTIIDANNDGSFVVNCDYCWIVKTPDLERGKEIANTTIQFYIPYLEPRIPGVQ